MVRSPFRRARAIAAAVIVSAAWLVAVAPPALAHNSLCQTIGTTSLHTGQTIGGGTSWLGIRSGIDPADGLHACTDTNGLDTVAGASMWVAVVPGPGNVEYNNPEAILQLGIIDCDALIYSVCEPQGAEGLHWFWADGGCNDAGPTPQPIDNNPNVSRINRTYSVAKIYDSPTVFHWVLSINGTPKVSIGPSTPFDWGTVNCWITGPLDLLVRGERNDAGDTFGTSSLPSQFTVIQRMSGTLGNATWSDVNVGACERTDGDSGCITPGSGNWTKIYNL